MGQYYKPINIDKKQFVYSHDYGNGLKLMEHSYIGNEFVAIVENLIKKNVAKDGTVLTGDWYGDRIVWAGDYADSEPLNGLTKDKNGKDLPNLYQIIGNYDLIGKWSRNRIVLLDKQPEDCTEIIFDLIEKQY